KCSADQKDCYPCAPNHPSKPAQCSRFPRRDSAFPALAVPFQPLKIGTNVRGVLVAQVLIFLQTLVDDVFELLRQIGIETHGWRGCSIQNRFEDHTRTFAAKR